MKKIVPAIGLTLALTTGMYLLLRILNFSQNTSFGKKIYEINKDQNEFEETEISQTLQHVARELSDLELIKETTETPEIYKTRYYDAGKITSGDYADYYKIIAIKESPNLNEPFIATFATTKSNEYVINKSNFDNYRNLTKPFFKIDLDKVKGFIEALLGHPLIIQLDDTWELRRGELNTELVDTKQKDEDGNSIFHTVVATDLSKYYKLTNVKEEFEIYGKAITTEFLAVDRYGISYRYSLVFKNKESLTLSSADLKKTNGSVLLYKKYSIALPSACVKKQHTPVAQSLTEEQIEEIAELGNIPVYTIKDPNHDYNKQSYNVKITTQWYGDDESFMEANSRERPDFETYVKQNPILVIKDPWGRDLLLGENDFRLMENCN
jgi:hypothetical protein